MSGAWGIWPCHAYRKEQRETDCPSGLACCSPRLVCWLLIWSGSLHSGSRLWCGTTHNRPSLLMSTNYEDNSCRYGHRPTWSRDPSKFSSQKILGCGKLIVKTNEHPWSLSGQILDCLSTTADFNRHQDSERSNRSWWFCTSVPGIEVLRGRKLSLPNHASWVLGCPGADSPLKSRGVMGRHKQETNKMKYIEESTHKQTR